MRLIDYVENYITENFNSHLQKEKEALISYLRNHKDTVIINKSNFNFDDYDRFIADINNLKTEKLINISEEEINVKKVNKDLIDLIKNYLSKDVTNVTLPVEVFNQLKIREYNKLKEITFNGRIKITKDFINKIIGFTNVDVIKGNFEIEKDLSKEGITLEYGFGNILFSYRDKIIQSKKFAFENSLSIYCENMYDRVDEINKLLNFENSKDLKDIKFYKNTDCKYSEYDIKLSTQKNYDNKDAPNESVVSFKNFNSIKDILNVIRMLEEKEINIDKVELYLQNKDYEDIYLLKEIEDKYRCKFNYEGSYNEITFEEFISMRETLNYYKNIILEANLSDLEKVTFAYDIIKSFEYKEVDDEEKSNSRNIHKIIKEGKIVCVGYSVFLSQLLKEVGIESYSISTTVPVGDQKFGHERNIINVTDKKYDVDGLFALDATWDSAHNLVKTIDEDGNEKIKNIKNKSDNEQVLKYYDNLSLYTYFLIPMNRYQEVFIGEKLPKMEDYNINALASTSVRNNYIQNNLPMIVKLLTNVRSKEGYPKEMIEDNIRDIVELIEYKNQKDNKNEISKKR